MKVVLNRAPGGFALSEQAYERLLALGVPLVDDPTNDLEWGELGFVVTGEPGAYRDLWSFAADPCYRNHPLLVQVAEELGAGASGEFAHLEVVEIPDDVHWVIHQWEDGVEEIRETFRRWP